MPPQCLQKIDHVPNSPGVYLFFDKAGELLYVGKTKNLRRRLSQYRKVKRVRKHARMRRLVKDLREFRFETCRTELDALLLENELIQKRKPKWNVAGAFYFLYPSLALKHRGTDFWIAYCTKPEELPAEYTLYGSFRSRRVTQNAYFALCRLFSHIGHRERGATPSRRIRPAWRERRFRQISAEWGPSLADFLDGRSDLLLEKIVHALLSKPKARRYPSEIQNHIDDLVRFYKAEACRLRFIKEKLGLGEKFIGQNERDRLYMIAKEVRSPYRADFHADKAP